MAVAPNIKIERFRAATHGRLVRALWPIAPHADAERRLRRRARRLCQPRVVLGRRRPCRLARGHQGDDCECPRGRVRIRGHRSDARCGSRRLFLRGSRRADRIARRHQHDRTIVRQTDRGPAAQLRAAADTAGPGMLAARNAAAFAVGIPRTGSRQARGRPVLDARDVVAQSASAQRRRRVWTDSQDRPGSHALRPRGAVGAGKGHRPDSHSKRRAHGARSAATRGAAPDGLDAAAAAHHRREPHFEGRDQWRRALQNSRVSGAPSIGTRHGSAGAVQSSERG